QGHHQYEDEFHGSDVRHVQLQSLVAHARAAFGRTSTVRGPAPNGSERRRVGYVRPTQPKGTPMAFLMTHFWPGATMEQYRASVAVVHPAGGLPEGQIHHAAGPTEGGVLI